MTDAGLTVLQEFSSLRYLNLSRCQVTDQGLESLKELKTLRSLKLASTATTDAGIAGLRQGAYRSPGGSISRLISRR